MTLAFSGTAQAGLLQNVLSTVTVPQGLNQLGQGIQGLLAGASTSVATGQATIQGFSTTIDPTIAGAITNLQTSATNLATHAAALDVAAAPGDVTAAVAGLQAEATGVLGSLSGVALTQALTNGLTIAQHVVSPVCSILGSPAALASGVGLDLTRLYPLAAPIGPYDKATSALLGNIYSGLYDAIVAGIPAQVATLPAPVGSTASIASALLTLLKYNWTSTYYPPGGGAPIVKTTKALLDVPTPIDVDNSGSFDLCGTTTLALDAGSGQLKVVQQITKLPLAPAVMPVDISGALLGVIGFGYNSQGSTAPVNYTSTVTLPGTNGDLISVDNTYTVHRGYTLTLPPLLSDHAFYPLPLGLPQAELPNLPALVQPAPKPSLTDVIAIGGSALQLQFRHEDVPNVTHDGVNLTGGLKYNYTGSSPSDRASFKTAVGTIGLGIGTSFPAGHTFNACVGGVLGGGNACGVPPVSTDNASLNYTSNIPTHFDVFQTISGTGTDCSSALPLLDAHLFGLKFAAGSTTGTTTPSSGRMAIDTGDNPVEGCVNVGTGTDGLMGTLPTGFKANQRVGLFHRHKNILGITDGVIADVKTGTITCPAGTEFHAPTEIVLTTYQKEGAICFLPPIPATPTITGQPYQAATLTAVPGTWGGSIPTFTYQWKQCDAAGNACTNIAGANASTYSPTAGDLGHTLRVAVTGTNPDGSATGTSAPTAVITLPPAPANTVAPAIGPVPVAGGIGSGRVLHTTNGTWINGVSSFAYQWKQCATVSEPNPASCPNASGSGATTADYTITQGDETKALFAVVTASNLGGAVAKASNGLRVPGKPVPTTAPSIKDGAVPAGGQPVLTGDHLNAVNGVWTDGQTFTYQWLRCDGSGLNCAPIAGSTGAQYTVTNDDIGSTLGLTVTAHNPNLLGGDGAESADAAPTGVVFLNDQILRTGVAVPDGTVNATAASSANTAYIGGSFDTVGLPTGGSAAVAFAATSTASGTPTTLGSGAVGGSVRAIEPDGAGGYYIGGSFTVVKGVPCPSLAHILVDGTVDPAYCGSGISGTVLALSRLTANSKFLAVGGSFTIGSNANLAFFDTTAAAPVATFATDGDPNGAVRTIVQDGATKFYLGGDFTTVGGTGAGHLAVELVTGTGPSATVARQAFPAAVCTTTSPGVCDADPSSSSVRTIYISTTLGGILVGGKFNGVYLTTGGAVAARGNGAAFSLGTTNVLGFGFGTGNLGVAKNWDPNANGPINSITSPGATSALGPYSMYIGGEFTTVGSANLPIKYLAEYGIKNNGDQSTSGTLNNSSPQTTFNANPNAPVNSIVANTTTTAANIRLVAGGAFTSIYGQPRHRIAVITGAGATASTLPVLNTALDPNAGSTVRALSRDSGATQILVGGDFKVVGGVTRNNAAEVGLGGVITGWNPNTDGPVNAIAPSGANVWIGGAFANAGGAARSNVAATAIGTGAATGSNPAVDGPVNALAAAPFDGAYVGGSFANSGGQPRASLAQLDGTGSTTSWNPGVTGSVKALSVNGSNVLVGGSFTAAGGAGRANLAEIGTTGTATGWNPGTNGSVSTLANSGGVIYAGGTFTSAGGSARNNIAAIDGSGVATTWDPNADGAVNSLLVVGPNVFAGGAFNNISGQPRGHAAGIDAGDATVLTSFDPQTDGPIAALTRTTSGSLVIGGSFLTAQNILTPALAFFGG